MSKKMTPPKRLFKREQLSPERTRLIDRLTRDCPDLRGVMSEAVAALDIPEVWKALALATETQRAATLLAWRDAAYGLKDGKPCDYCRATAAHIRFAVIYPGEDFRAVKQVGDSNALMGFSLLCGQCALATQEQHKRRMLDEYAKIQPELGDHPFRRAAILGKAVGAGGPFPQRRGLQPCQDCTSMVWVNQDESDLLAEESPVYLCTACAGKRVMGGTLDCVPAELITP